MGNGAISSLSLSVGHDKKSSYVDHSLLSKTSKQAPTVALATPPNSIWQGNSGGQTASAFQACSGLAEYA